MVEKDPWRDEILRYQLDQFFSLWQRIGLIEADIEGCFDALMKCLPPDAHQKNAEIEPTWAAFRTARWLSAYKDMFLSVAANEFFKVWERPLLKLFFAGLKTKNFRAFFPMGTILFDVNRLHDVNMRFGKFGGNQVINAILDVVRENTRSRRRDRRKKESRILVPMERREHKERRHFPDFISRVFSGDEFSVHLSRVGSPVHLLSIKMRIEDRVRELGEIPIYDLQGREMGRVRPTASFGATIIPKIGVNVFEVFGDIEEHEIKPQKVTRQGV